MTARARIRTAFAVACLLGGATASSWALPAQWNGNQPDELEGLTVDERLEQRVPADLVFVDSAGAELTAAQALTGDVPTILTFNYSDCPMLCSMQLNGLVDAIEASELRLGEDFRVVTIGLDPLETPERAAKTRARYYDELGLDPARAGWSFLLGDEPTIRRAAESVGFGYRYVEDSGEYAHAAVQMVLMPDGRVSRYLYGVDVPGRDLRLALVEASEGRIGTSVDAFLLFCFHYDPGTGGYTFAWTTMRLGGALTIAALLGGLYWLRRARRAQAIDRAYA